MEGHSVPPIVFHDVCQDDELWLDEMEAFTVDGRSILIIKTAAGTRAYSNICPHQDVPLVEGRLDDCVLTCRAHHWTFDVQTGLSVNPTNQRLVSYPVRVADGMIQVGDCPIDPATL